jgi:hypothetical protein
MRSGAPRPQFSHFFCFFGDSPAQTGGFTQKTAHLAGRASTRQTLHYRIAVPVCLLGGHEDLASQSLMPQHQQGQARNTSMMHLCVAPRYLASSVACSQFKVEEIHIQWSKHTQPCSQKATLHFWPILYAHYRGLPGNFWLYRRREGLYSLIGYSNNLWVGRPTNFATFRESWWAGLRGLV